MSPAPAPKEYELHVDGQPVDMDDWTFAEQAEYRALVRESAEDPDLRVALAEPMDRYPAMITVIKRRTNPDFSLADAKTLKIDDALRPVSRPTKAAKGK